MSTTEGVMFVYGKPVNDMVITKEAAINAAQRVKEQGQILDYRIEEETETTGKIIAICDPNVSLEPLPIWHINPEDVEKVKTYMTGITANQTSRIMISGEHKTVSFHETMSQIENIPGINDMELEQLKGQILHMGEDQEGAG